MIRLKVKEVATAKGIGQGKLQRLADMDIKTVKGILRCMRRMRLKIREMAEQKGVSQYRLHLKSEIALSSIRKFYQDPYTDIKLSTLARIADVLDCDVCDLFETEDREKTLMTAIHQGVCGRVVGIL